MKGSKIFFVMLFALLLSGCTSETGGDEERKPTTMLSDISGVWVEYAYLCADGYFVDISGTGYDVFFDFDFNGTFTKYTVDSYGHKEMVTQGKWVFDANNQTAHIEEPKGWNLDVYFSFSDIDNATMTIKGRSSSETIKAKKLSQQ